MAAIGLSGVVGLLFEVAELQGAFVFRRAEFDTAFAGRVVEDELVVATLPALAGIELLAFETGQTGVVGVGFGFLAGKEGWRIGAGLHGTAADPIALGIGALCIGFWGVIFHLCILHILPFACFVFAIMYRNYARYGGLLCRKCQRKA